jgi:hypothetical protein
MTTEDGTDSSSRKVVRKFILLTMQNPQNQESTLLAADAENACCYAQILVCDIWSEFLEIDELGI